MKQGLISIIVPIYNVEAYLKKCIESICEQSYKELEIILVDDESPDNCGHICDEYAKKDTRIKVIHKKNGGISDARNAGLDIATGEYIGFVDGDDYIHPQMFEILYNGINQNDADVSICLYKKVSDKEQVVYEQYDNTDDWLVIIDDKDKLKYSFGEKSRVSFILLWNKLYKAKIFDEIRFPYGKTHEDQFTTYKTIHLADKVAYTKKELYYYIQRQGSIMHSDFSKKRLDDLDALKEKLELYEKTNRFDWYEKNLELYRYTMLQMTFLISKSQNADIKWLLPYKKFYNQQVIKNVWKLPVKMKKIGYLKYVFLPKTYYKQKYEMIKSQFKL